MRWTLGVNWTSPLEDPIAEGRRIWAWIQAVRPLHPSLDLWRPTMDTRQLAEQAPPITPDLFLERIHTRQQETQDIPGIAVTPAFSGQIGHGNKLSLSLGYPTPDINGLDLYIGDHLSTALETNPALADALLATAADHLTPTIASLQLNSAPLPAQQTPYKYVQGWKMYFPITSPHHQRAHQLATQTLPTTNGHILTYGTPNTYPTILNQWTT